jgi:hypothetical protein
MWRWIMLALFTLVAPSLSADSRYFGIQVVDEVTGRGVPLVELRTTNDIPFVTDSAGWVAFDEPGLMDRTVWFTITSHGYEYPADGFGFHGLKLTPKAGETTTVKIKRINIAERLYRATGGGIYRDSVMLGKSTPTARPLLNADLLGCDSVLSTLHNGTVYWFWGDTNRVAYPLGNFRTTSATSLLPKDKGLPPSVGVDFTYFVGEDGFPKQTIPMTEPGPVWMSGLVTILDDTGTERIVAHYSRMKDLGTRLERGLAAYDDAINEFKVLKKIDLEAPLAPDGHPTKVTIDGTTWIYFNVPYPNMRVRDDWKSFQDLTKYEGFTPLKPRTAKLDAAKPQLDRDASGKLNWSWKPNTAIVSSKEIETMISSGTLKADEAPFHLTDAATGKVVTLAGGSFYWNDYRKKYLMTGIELMGTSVLGEIWYAEADKLEGPWRKAVKVVTHNQQDLYNPKQHPFFDEDGGRVIYFEGTYTHSFSGTTLKTPRYEYNQMMYRLDLNDPRLNGAKN